MAGPKPDDPYSPIPRVAPEARMPYDTLAQRTTAQDFGSAKSQAIEHFGNQVSQGGDKLYQYEMQQLGLANEAAANEAEMRLVTEGGDLYNQFKSREGFDASNSRQDVISKYTQLNDNIRKTLGNPMAQRAYDQLAGRRLAYTIQDINNHAASELKKAYRQGRSASASLSMERLATPEVAESDAQSNLELVNIFHQLNSDFTDPDSGMFATLPVKVNTGTGRLEFDADTPQGKAAQATYNNYIDTALDKAWTARINAVAYNPKGYNNINRAVNMLEANQNNMPRVTYAKLAKSLNGPYRTGEARSMAERKLDFFNQSYLNSFESDQADFNYESADGMVSKGNLNPYDRKVLFNPEGTASTTSSISIGTDKGEVVIPTVVDGKRLSNQEAIEHYKKTGENFGTFKTPEQADKFAESLHNSQAGDTRFKIASLVPGSTVTSAYRTPEHNAEVGGVPNSQHTRDTALDIVLPQGVTFDQFKQKLADSGINTSELKDEGDHIHVAWGSKRVGLPGADRYKSPARFYQEHRDDILESIRQEADAKWGDPTLTDQTVAYASSKIDSVLRSAQLQTTADRDNILDYIKKSQVINTDQLNSAPPEIRDAWNRFQTDNPGGAERLEKGLLVANANGQALTYGSNFWKNYLDASSGRVHDITDFHVDTGRTAAFTNTGMEELNSRMKTWRTPEGKTWQDAETKFLKQLHREYTGAGLIPGIPDQYSSPEFNQVLKEVLPKINAGKKEGKTPAQLFSPTINGKPNPDYIVSSYLPPSYKTIMERFGQLSMFNQGVIPTKSGPVTPVVKQNSPQYDPKKKYTSLDELDKDASLMTEDEYVRRSIELGFASQNAPRPQ